MVFSSTIFLFVFLPVVVACYYLINPKYRNILLLIASLGFYAWGEIKYISILFLSIFANYIFGLLVDKFREKKNIVKLIMTVMVIFNVFLLYVFKYLNFTIQNINSLLNTDIALRAVVLPIGISFFTFKAISYVVDVYKNKGAVQKNILNVALYISFFPQLLAGPIGRYETMEIEIEGRKESWTLFTEGVARFIIGLGKKVIIANSLVVVADRSFAITEYGSLSVALAWLGAICYTLQIFFDFSGYSDMAIGLGKMFGFNFPENFNYPYVSSSVSDFWRRWHISLSQWFRDYVYIPLGGSRVSKGRMLFNLFVVWMLTGFWHGSSWNFVFWGLFYFVLLTFEKMLKIQEKLKNQFLKISYRIFTLLCIVFGWVLFRATGLKSAVKYMLSMFGLNNNALSDVKTVYIFQDYLILLIIAIIACIPIAKWLVLKIKNEKTLIIYEGLRVIALLVLLIICISYCVNGSYNPFIYFNF